MSVPSPNPALSDEMVTGLIVANAELGLLVLGMKAQIQRLQRVARAAQPAVYRPLNREGTAALDAAFGALWVGDTRDEFADVALKPASGPVVAQAAADTLAALAGAPPPAGPVHGCMRTPAVPKADGCAHLRRTLEFGDESATATCIDCDKVMDTRTMRTTAELVAQIDSGALPSG